MSLVLQPITLREACAFVDRVHRTHRAPRSLMYFAVACSGGGGAEVLGVAIIGRPEARMLCDGWTAEVRRVATDGSRNACSLLYAAAWRAARALGYRRLLTYTLPEEGGASLRAAGWKLIGQAGGGTWNRKDRPRVDTHPTQRKLRWEAAT